ncbi:MAG TPA: phosphoribosyltransferase family protein [Tepidisphaeraceae bacterium]|jgi:ComF family protein|nr:phosphoribosyltransferase family protein [Tepidisphaeraceae bacterium]
MGRLNIILQVRQWGGDLLNLCYPAVCSACEAPAPVGAFLCEACEVQLAQLAQAAACERCAMPLAVHGSPCPWCEGDGLRPYARIARLGTMSSPLKHLIHLAKYNRRWPIAERLADRLMVDAQVQAILRDTDVLLPVPLHAWRQMRRGFNQADVIASRLGRCGKVRVVRPVVRLRPTDTQTHMHGRSKRAENLKDAFGLIRPADVAGKRVTVVDDVLTTGATLQSLARTLRPARPASLSAITLAIADPEGRQFEVV